MPWPQTCATEYHVQLGLQDKGRAIIVLVFCNDRDLKPFDLPNGLALIVLQLEYFVCKER